MPETHGTDLVRARVLISGMVQGVNFRASTRAQARLAGVGGWVRNRADGRVEALFEGSRHQVEALLRWCQHGPRSAEVDQVEVQWQAPAGDQQDFRVVG
jgi:acylphosphatase